MSGLAWQGQGGDACRQDVLEELVERYESLKAQGQPASAAELCRDDPELAGELQRRIAALERVDALLSFAERDETPPQQLGRYRLDELIGEGGYGQVWRSYDVELQRPVAVKIPAPPGIGSLAARDIFLKEAQKVAKLQHPHIVPVYDVGQDGPYVFIVLEWIDGTSLAQRLKDGPGLDRAEACRIVAEVADALYHAHSQGIIHRDVKLANILLDKEGRAYLTDFGIAAEEEKLPQERAPTTGTLPYMAPEQLQGENFRVSPRTDIYSLGVVLYELLTGRRPFRAEHPEELRQQILKTPPKSPREINSKIPRKLEKLCLKALRKNPEDRYASARDLAEALRRPEVLSSAPLIPKRRGPVWVVGALAAIVVAAIAAIFFIPPLPLSADLNVWVWSAADPVRKGLRLDDPQALPVRAGDLVQVEMELSKPAYPYLLWLSADGKLTPLYPWKLGQWDRPTREVPTRRVRLPEAAAQGWPMEGPAGMESLLLLVREKPFPPEIDLKQLLSKLPQQPLHDPQALVRFADGKVVFSSASRPRGPRVDSPQPINDLLLKMHLDIHHRLGPHIKLSRAVSFAFQGEDP